MAVAEGVTVQLLALLSEVNCTDTVCPTTACVVDAVSDVAWVASFAFWQAAKPRMNDAEMINILLFMLTCFEL